MSWLAQFRACHGRPLRVLHIGNIANNGYNNAQIQRAHGIEADVVAYDYFHVMGCAEWESATIEGEIADPFYPDWWTVDLGDWRRPAWFYQGPRDACLAALRAAHSGNRLAAVRARLELVEANFALLDGVARSAGRERAFASPYAKNALVTTLRLAGLDPSKATACLARHLRHLGKLTDRRRLEDLKAQLSTARLARSGRARAALRLAAGVMAASALRPLSRRCHGPASSFHGKATSSPSASVTTERHLEAYRACHPGVADHILAGDLAEAAARAGAWSGILEHYDIIQGYSVDGLIPLFNGEPRFVAYEHGTLRVYPFEDNSQSRLCRYTYACAPRVAITNTDVLPSADRIGIPEARRIHLPAAVDYCRIDQFRAANGALQPPEDQIVIFGPARHHWRSGDGNWLKGNDVLLRGAARVLAQGRQFRLVLVEWGQEVDASKALIDELEIGGVVKWVQPMDKQELWRMICRSHAVADQFVLPAMGGIGIETLALGRRLISHIDTPTLARFFGSSPPVLAAGSIEDVAMRLAAVITDPDDRAGIGLAGRKWLETYHSPTRILNLQIEAYRSLLEEAPVCRAPQAS